MALRAVVPRDPHEQNRVASPLELFTDLCFVVAISQAAGLVHHNAVDGEILRTIAGFTAAFFGIWWAWLNFAWFCSAYDNDDVGHRILSLIQVIGSLIFAAGVTRMFDGDFRIGVTGYVVMRLALVVQWLRAAAGDPERRPTALRYAAYITIVQTCWVVFLLLPSALVWPAFVLFAIADMAVPTLAERAGRTPWHPHHIAERYGLFFIIVLGETVLSTTIAIQSAIDAKHPAPELAFVVLGGILIIFSMWWLYFSREAGDILESQDVAFAWGFGHYFIFASGALIGAGLAIRVDFRSGHADIGAYESAALVTLPVVVLLASLWWVSIRLHDSSIRTWGPFVVAMIACAAATYAPAPELMTGLICVALLVVELRLTSDEPVGVPA